MHKSLAQQVKQGKEYVDLWPQKPELTNYFSEYRAVIVSRFLFKYGAPLALVALLMPILTIGTEQIKQGIVYGLFMATLPVQALFMMYKKSEEKLPPSLASWYREGVEKIKQQEPMSEQSLSVNQPKFLDLAKLLNISYQSKRF